MILKRYRYKCGKQITCFEGQKVQQICILLTHAKYRNPFMGIVNEILLYLRKVETAIRLYLLGFLLLYYSGGVKRLNFSFAIDDSNKRHRFFLKTS